MNDGIQFHCVVCKGPIPDKRMMNQAVTCGSDCARKLRVMRQKLRDRVRCRLCGAPVTQEERKQFRQWREAAGTLRQRGRPPKPKG